MNKILCIQFNRWWLPFLFLLATTVLRAQVTKVFDKTIGGNAFDNAKFILATGDGGFLLGGNSSSNSSGDKTEDSKGANDIWLVKVNASGGKLWDKTIGGSNYESLMTIVATPDGGFLLGGASDSDAGGDKSENGRGYADCWLVKIDSDGTKRWDKTFGGELEDQIMDIAVLPNNQGYLLGCLSSSPPGPDKTAPLKSAGDYWVIRVDLDGNKVWDKAYGGSEFQYLTNIIPTSDGKFVLFGSSWSNAGGDKTENVRGTNDYWLVKIDADGNKLWDKTIGGDQDDDALSGTATSDGGVVVSGASSSNKSFDKSTNCFGVSDYWVVKVDADGHKSWDKTLGGIYGDYPTKIISTADGGYLVGGFSNSTRNALKSEDSRGDRDFWVVKLTSQGEWSWDKTLGGTDYDELAGISQSATGDFYLLGGSYSNAGGDKTENVKGVLNYWLVALRESPCTTPTLTYQLNSTTIPILQNTPEVMLTVNGCESGQISWSGPNGVQGAGPFIPVPTSAIGTKMYSVTCTRGSCSATITPTVEVVGSSVSGAFDGYVYGADCSTFRGWAWDGNKPNTPVSVEILDGPNVIGTLTAGEFRADLQKAGKGNGNHAFYFSIPERLIDNNLHLLTARIRGSNFILKGSPKALVCRQGDFPENKPPVAPTPTVLIAPVVAQLNVPFSATLVAFSDPEGAELFYWLDNLPNGLYFDPFERIIYGTPKTEGTFVIAYQAADDYGNTNSVSFNLTVLPASTSSVTGSFDGYLDKVECGSIRGWVWDRNKPNTPLTVEFYTENSPGNVTVWGSTLANIYRPDLKDAGKGNGAHAYGFETPAALKDGTQRVIRARVQGSVYELKWSGKELKCNTPGRLSAETGSGLQVRVLGNPVSDQLQVEITGAEGQPLQLKLTDASGRLVSQRQIETAQALEHQHLSIHHQAPGLLLLRVTSGRQSATLKVLKE
ncbi:putative Ig domain-containing protein [Larkinella rosea]|uniref:T9SS C-terminal target domain-containing protein n=1 Tax=Larkinella rosea TaxID=2025312 RepID=A0A3P1BGG6_9BACT|nr:putative Ig domain-containing protein [Larkinella rosea]RRA99985.1 T9SS C-terminal target domain-containing protein [Larkinella rosea]